MENKSSPSCADELTWQRLADGEIDPDHAELLWHHLSICEGCRACMASVQADRRFVGELLGTEDDDTDVGDAVNRVQLRLGENRAHGSIAGSPKTGATIITSAHPRWTWRVNRGLWPRLAAAAALAAVVSIVMWLPSSNVGASPDFVLSRAEVSARAWTYQPGKVLRWVTESEIKGHPSIPDGKYRSLWWRSNVEGNRGEILRNYDEQNRLSYGRWLKADGREVYFSSRGVEEKPNLLTIRPPDASLAALLPSLPAAQQEPVRQYLQQSASTPGYLSHEMADRFGEWLVEAAEGRKRNRTIERLSTPEWGTVYYVRGEWSQDDSPGGFGRNVSKFVDEQYVGLEDFRIHRRKTTRYNERGEAVHVEDARYRGFGETTIAEFRAEDLDLDGPMPSGWTVVRLTPEQHAERIARFQRLRRASTAAPQPGAPKTK